MIIQKVVKLAMEVFEQKTEDFAGKADTRELTADLALDFSAALKNAFSQQAEKPIRYLSNPMTLSSRLSMSMARNSAGKWPVPKSF